MTHSTLLMSSALEP